MNDSDPLNSKRSKRKSQEVCEVAVKRAYRSSSSSSDSGQQSSSQLSDTSAKLKPLKTDPLNRSKLPVPIRSHSSSDSAEDLPSAGTQQAVRRPLSCEPSVTRIPDIEVTAPKESVRTPVEGDTMAVDFGSVSPKHTKLERTPTKGNKVPDEAASDKKNSAEKLKARRSSKERRKSKRRSSFVIGRVTRQAPALSSSELCENIPLDLPDAERLEKLSLLALQYTLDKLHSEFGDVHGFQQFATKCMCGVEEKIGDMKQLFTDATTKRRIVPNPVNVRRAADVAQLKADRTQLQREIGEWDNILEQYSQQATEATRQYEDLASHPITMESCTLSSRQKSILNGRLDLQKIVTDLTDMKETTVLALDAIAQKVRLLSAVGDVAGKEIEKHSQILASKSFPQQQEVDPRTLIENCLSL